MAGRNVGPGPMAGQLLQRGGQPGAVLQGLPAQQRMQPVYAAPSPVGWVSAGGQGWPRSAPKLPTLADRLQALPSCAGPQSQSVVAGQGKAGLHGQLHGGAELEPESSPFHACRPKPRCSPAPPTWQGAWLVHRVS